MASKREASLSPLARHALALLRANPEYVADAREGVRVSNSVIGSVLSMQFQAPRWAAEQAVRDALACQVSKRRASNQRYAPEIEARRQKGIG